MQGCNPLKSQRQAGQAAVDFAELAVVQYDGRISQILDDLQGLREAFRNENGTVDVHAVDSVEFIRIDDELRIFRKSRLYNTKKKIK